MPDPHQVSIRHSVVGFDFGAKVLARGGGLKVRKGTQRFSRVAVSCPGLEQAAGLSRLVVLGV